MSSLMIGVLGIILLIVLLLAGKNIGFTMLFVGFVGYAMVVSIKAAMGVLQSVPFSRSSNFDLSVIPLFVLMGQFAFHAGLSGDLYDFCHKFLGRVPGGLAVATIAACAGFAAICGSSTACAATMGVVCLPEMKKYNYDDALSTGCLAAGGTLGILIPPSVGFILYGISAEESIGALFAAGILPGILLSLFFIATIVIQVVRKPALGPKGDRYTIHEKLSSLKNVVPILILFVVVIGGIFIGLFTANEGAAIGAFGAFIFMIIRKKANWPNIKTALFESLKTTAMIFLIIIGAYVFGAFLTVSGLPTALASAISSLPVSRYLILVLILLVYVALGCIMDSLSMVMLLVPIFLPIIKTLGFDPIWFGVLMVMVMETGLITPPVGLNAYVISGVAKDVPLHRVFQGVVPFIFALFAAVAVVIIFPQLALFLPGLMY